MEKKKIHIQTEVKKTARDVAIKTDEKQRGGKEEKRGVYCKLTGGETSQNKSREKQRQRAKIKQKRRQNILQSFQRSIDSERKTYNPKSTWSASF